MCSRPFVSPLPKFYFYRYFPMKWKKHGIASLPSLKTRANGDECDLWDIYSARSPHLFLRAWFALHPMARRKSSKKRNRNEETRYEWTSYTGASIIRRILNYLFISPRFIMYTMEFCTIFQNVVSLAKEKSKKISAKAGYKFNKYLFF